MECGAPTLLPPYFYMEATSALITTSITNLIANLINNCNLILPQGWPLDASPDYPTSEDRITRIQISGLICSHIVVLLIGIYIGRRLKQS